MEQRFNSLGRVINGRAPDVPDKRDKRFKANPVVKLKTMFIPKTVLWDSWSGPVKDQGADGKCTAFAACDVWEVMNNVNGYIWGQNDVNDFSEEMAYYYAKLNDEIAGEDYEGSTCRGVAKGMYKMGVCQEYLWPYDQKNPAVWDYYLDAGKRKVRAYKSVFDNSGRVTKNQLIQALYHGPIIGGFCLTKNFDMTGSDGIVVDEEIDFEAGHAMAVEGWYKETDMFLIKNSWSPTWAKKGYCLIKSDLMLKMMDSGVILYI